MLQYQFLSRFRTYVKQHKTIQSVLKAVGYAHISKLRIRGAILPLLYPPSWSGADAQRRLSLSIVRNELQFWHMRIFKVYDLCNACFREIHCFLCFILDTQRPYYFFCAKYTFSKTSRPTPELTQPPTQWVPGPFPSG
jgi:hypothetical protein